MRRAVWLLLVFLPFFSAGCTGASGPSPTARVQPTPSETRAAVVVPTFMEVLPTPTPLAPPPAPTSLPTTSIPTSTPALNATPAVEPTAIPTKEIAEVPMIAIPAGEFTMGNDAGDGDETPAHKVSVAAFEIDQFEVTNEQFQAFVDKTGYVSTAEKAHEALRSSSIHGATNGRPVKPIPRNQATVARPLSAVFRTGPVPTG
jgi:formylglycine-generating enzyme required for sulfatase activity